MLYDNLSVNEAGHLVFAGYDTAELAKEYGTSLMLLDESAIRSRCRRARACGVRRVPVHKERWR